MEVVEINMAFLYSILDEEIFMKVLEGFETYLEV